MIFINILPNVLIAISGSDLLSDLLKSLAAETGKKLTDFKFHAIETEGNLKSVANKENLSVDSSFEDNLHLESQPLSEEDLLKRPFYTVEEPQVQQNIPQGIKIVQGCSLDFI